MPDPSPLPGLHLDDALDHASARRSALVGSRAWWLAIHTALAAPAVLTERQRMLLPGDLDRALASEDDDVIVEAWLDAPIVNDRLWTIGAHCPEDRHLVAHLVLAAAQGAPHAIAEMICRDLLRMCAIDADRWGGPVAASTRTDEARAFAARLGISIGPFRDLYDVAAGTAPSLVIDAVCRGGVRHSGEAMSDLFATAVVGEVLVVDAGDLYDRQIVQVTRRDGSSVIHGVELVSTTPCTIAPDTGTWTLTVAIGDAGDEPTEMPPCGGLR